MPERKEIYKCEACGNIVEVLEGGGAELVCCGEEMSLFEEKTQEQGKEKHVPVVDAAGGNSIIVKVGSNPHPMEEKHYIQWIEATDKDRTYRHYLKPGQDPETVFTGLGPDIKVREYCNLHGLWTA